MTITTEQKESIILLFSIGLAYALKKKVIDVETSEKLLFSPRTQAELTKHLGNKNLVELVHLGTELENVESLLPENWDDRTQEILNMATRLLAEKPSIYEDRIDWYDDLFK